MSRISEATLIKSIDWRRESFSLEHLDSELLEQLMEDPLIAEIHFPSMSDLQACAASDGARETLANAVSISTGGPPIFIVAKEETFSF